MAEGREKDRGGNPEEEIGKYRAILDKDPQSRVFAPLAEAYRKAGYLEEAVETARGGLSHHPSYLSGRVALARALFERGDFAEAKSEISQVIQAAPDNLMAHKLIGQIQLQSGDAAAAEKSFNMVLLLDPRDQEAQAAIDNLKAPAPEPVEPPPVESAPPEEAPVQDPGPAGTPQAAGSQQSGREEMPAGLVLEGEEGEEEAVFEQAFDDLTDAEETIPAFGDTGEEADGDADAVSAASRAAEEPMFDIGPVEPPVEEDAAPTVPAEEPAVGIPGDEAAEPDVEEAEDLSDIPFDMAEEELDTFEAGSAEPADMSGVEPFELEAADGPEPALSPDSADVGEEEPEFMDSPGEAAEIEEEPFSLEPADEGVPEATSADAVEAEKKGLGEAPEAQAPGGGDVPFDLTGDDFETLDATELAETGTMVDMAAGTSGTSVSPSEDVFAEADTDAGTVTMDDVVPEQLEPEPEDDLLDLGAGVPEETGPVFEPEGALSDLGQEGLEEAETAAGAMARESTQAEEGIAERSIPSPAEEEAFPAAAEVTPAAELEETAQESAAATGPPPAGEGGPGLDGDAFNTETLAHLYVKQGFYDKAAGVYEAMLRDNPADTALRQKFEEARALAGMVQEGSPAKVAAVPAATPRVSGGAAGEEEHPAIIGLRRFLEQLKERKP